MPPPAKGFASRLFVGPALRAQPDRRLVTLVREGYEAAFEEIVRRYGRPLTRYAASIVGGRSEDVTQDAFSKALLALRRNDAVVELRPWLFRIVRNTALNDLRDRPPSPELLAEAIAGGANPAEELERREELTDLIERLQALPEPQRAAIVMRELEGLGHEEIAAALGLTGGGARQAIHRARQALRNGAGMLIPLPLLQAMLGGAGPGAAETALGAAGVSSAAGAGVALKATAATVLVAGAVGAGVTLTDNPHGGDARAAPVRVSQRGSSETASAPPAGARDLDGRGGRHASGGGDGRHRGRGEAGDDHGGHGEDERGDDHRGERGSIDDHGGRGETGGGDDDRSGPSEHHGGSSGPDGADRSGISPSGSGSGSSTSGSGSGHGGSGSSDAPGSGEGDSTDSSGPGSVDGGGGGSGTGEDLSGSGGSGSGDSASFDDGSGSGSSSGPGSGDVSALDDHSGESG